MSEKNQSEIPGGELQKLYEEVYEGVDKGQDEFKIKPHEECKGGLPLFGSLVYYSPDLPVAKDEVWRLSTIICECACGEERVFMRKDREWKSAKEYCELLGIKYDQEEDPADTGELIGWEGKE